jgi:hypothetical protein
LPGPERQAGALSVSKTIAVLGELLTVQLRA